MPTAGRIARAGDQLPCQLVVDIILILANVFCLGPSLWLILFEPQGFARHPFGGEGTFSTAVYIQGWIATAFFQYVLGLWRRAGIHPKEAGPKGSHALTIEGHDAAARSVDAYGLDVGWISTSRKRTQATSHGLTEVVPPIVGILFGPARIWMGRFVRHRTGRADRLASDGIEGTCSDGLGASIDADYERRR